MFITDVIEDKVLGLIVKGHSNQEIADSLDLPLRSVKWAVQKLCRKHEVENRYQLIRKVWGGR